MPCWARGGGSTSRPRPSTAPSSAPHSGLGGTDNDLALLATRAKAGGLLPRLRVDCGTDDFLIEDNRTFNRQLVDAGVDHQYVEYPGSHTWESTGTSTCGRAIEFHVG